MGVKGDHILNMLTTKLNNDDMSVMDILNKESVGKNAYLKNYYQDKQMVFFYK